MMLEPSRRHPVMCITQDAPALAHEEQASRLCAAGARWIQLRAKSASRGGRLRAAREIAAICRAHDAVFVVDDDVEVALAAGADGVHLGRRDLDWREARRRLGPRRLLGGTVNDHADAARARACGVLDYVGVGPLRFTATKAALSPVLGLAGVRALLEAVGALPAWVIGGVEASDLPVLRDGGAAGVAVSSALFRGGDVEANLAALAAAWRMSTRIGCPP